MTYIIDKNQANYDAPFVLPELRKERLRSITLASFIVDAFPTSLTGTYDQLNLNPTW